MEPLHSFNARRVQLSQRATWVLGGWAAANLGGRRSGERGGRTRHGGVILRHHDHGLEHHQPGHRRARPFGPTQRGTHPTDITGTFKAQRRTEALYLINTGLDLGYMGLGLWMQERGLCKSGEDGARLRGIGNAILVQGAFLFACDLVAYVTHSLHWKRKRGGLYRQLQFNGTSLSHRL